MRRNLGTVIAKSATGRAAGTGPALPGLAAEQISTAQAAAMLECRKCPTVLARLGLKPLGEVTQLTPQGKLTFRAYDRSAVLEIVRKRNEAKRAELAKREARENAIREATATALAASGVLAPPASTPTPADPTPRQTFAILCEIRDLLKTLRPTA